MTKEEYILDSLSSALEEMKNVSNKLICTPQLKEKADILYKEIQKEYESSFQKQK